MHNGLNNINTAIPVWFEVLAKFESLMSLSVLKIDQFDVVLPEIQKEKTLVLPIYVIL